jgi:hypothetical protein
LKKKLVRTASINFIVFFEKIKDSFKSVDVAEVDGDDEGDENDEVDGVVDVTKVDVATVEVEMVSGVEVGICSLFVLSEKRIGGIFAIAKLEALISSSALLNLFSN